MSETLTHRVGSRPAARQATLGRRGVSELAQSLGAAMRTQGDSSFSAARSGGRDFATASEPRINTPSAANSAPHCRHRSGG